MRSTIPHIVSWLFMWPTIPHIVSWLFMWPTIYHPVHARRYVHACFHHTYSVLCMLDAMCCLHHTYSILCMLDVMCCLHHTYMYSVLCMLDVMCMHVSTIHTASCTCMFPPYIQRPVHARRYVNAYLHHTYSVLNMLDAM